MKQITQALAVKSISESRLYISSNENIAELLLPALQKCRTFILSDKDGNASEVFFGEACFVRDGVFITYDCFRLNVGKMFYTNEFLVFMLPENGVDIMLSDGRWLSCAFGGNYQFFGRSVSSLRFDADVIVPKGNVAIIDFSKIKVSDKLKKIVSPILQFLPFDSYIQKTPYTIAYRNSKNGKISAGCWDIMNERFVYPPRFVVKNFLT